jgi:hypothetical protein
MTLGSFTHGALADLTLEDVERMLELDETLFVEHKRGVGDKGNHQLVRAVAAFANTLGGWLLLGVHKREPVGGDPPWADETITLVDFVRDRLRGEIDPLPPFEARVIAHPKGPVGVVRVYESSDTPHVALHSGAVFVREVAGVGDASDTGKPGAGVRGERTYDATKIRSSAHLRELAGRGRRAAERVATLVDPARTLPLISEGLGLSFERVEARIEPIADQGSIFVRLIPYTLVPRFPGWSTTAEASAAVLTAAEDLAQLHGLANDWKIPDPAGVAIEVPVQPGVRHQDGAGLGLEAVAKIVVDGAGLAGAALQLIGPDEKLRRSWTRLDALAQGLIAPTIRAAADVLDAGELLGRARCQIDLVGLSGAILIEGGGNQEPRRWVPTSVDVTLPLDDAQLAATAQLAANAYARSARIPAWDAPSPVV